MDDDSLRLSPFDAADYLKTDEAVAAYLEEVISEDDPKAFLQALNTVARARGMSKLARDTGLSRENLYRSLSANGNPEFNTLWKIASALGCSLVVRPKKVMPA